MRSAFCCVNKTYFFHLLKLSIRWWLLIYLFVYFIFLFSFYLAECSRWAEYVKAKHQRGLTHMGLSVLMNSHFYIVCFFQWGIKSKSRSLSIYRSPFSLSLSLPVRMLDFPPWTTTAAIFHQPLCQQQPKNQLIFLTYKRSDYQGLYDTALSKETLDVSEVNFGLQWVWRSNKAKPHQVKKSTQDWPPLEKRLFFRFYSIWLRYT